MAATVVGSEAAVAAFEVEYLQLLPMKQRQDSIPRKLIRVDSTESNHRRSTSSADSKVVACSVAGARSPVVAAVGDRVEGIEPTNLASTASLQTHRPTS